LLVAYEGSSYFLGDGARRSVHMQIALFDREVDVAASEIP
jgi:hypothetical protein